MENKINIIKSCDNCCHACSSLDRCNYCERNTELKDMWEPGYLYEQQMKEEERKV